MNIHFLGTFTNIDDVYKIYPSGGVYGDYIVLNNETIYWNDNQRIWGDFAGFEPVAGVDTQTIDGNLNVSGNIRAGGAIVSRFGNISELTVEKINLINNPFATSDHTHNNYAFKSHTHLLSDVKDLKKYVNGVISETGLSMVLVWQELGSVGEEQIDISHLNDVLNYFGGLYLSKKKDDFAEGNIAFRKMIDVKKHSTFRGGATFISNTLPEEIHNSVLEPDAQNDNIATNVIEDNKINNVIASGILEEFAENENDYANITIAEYRSIIERIRELETNVQQLNNIVNGNISK